LDEDNKPFLRVKCDIPKRPEDREGEILTGLEAESTAMEHDDSEEEDDNVHHIRPSSGRSGSTFSDPFKRMLESGLEFPRALYNSLFGFSFLTSFVCGRCMFVLPKSFSCSKPVDCERDKRHFVISHF
jgi:hypothetical protein